MDIKAQWSFQPAEHADGLEGGPAWIPRGEHMEAMCSSLSPGNLPL